MESKGFKEGKRAFSAKLGSVTYERGGWSSGRTEGVAKSLFHSGRFPKKSRDNKHSGKGIRNQLGYEGFFN